MEDSRRSHSSRKMPKSSNSLRKASKKTCSSTSHDYNAVVVDGRRKRTWKACERCRMKKTKCDGESPCKRCKDDGLVCTAGSRKKTEFKQLPLGYAEVLENTQYALIATVQKLYTMVRNNESWDLGELEMNDRGQPVIHDIASKLGCIRPTPNLPYAFPEGENDFADLQAQLQMARSETGSEDVGSRKECSSVESPVPDRTDRTSSSESKHSIHNQTFSSLQRKVPASSSNLPLISTTSIMNASPRSMARKPASFDEESYNGRTSFDTASSMPSPVYTDFQTESPMFRNASPFSSWSGWDHFIGQPHDLDLTAHYTKSQTQYGGIGMPRHSPLAGQVMPLGGDILKAMQSNDELNFADGIIRPGMLDCNTGYDISNQLDSIIYGGGDYAMA